jgi:hypothetical protein
MVIENFVESFMVNKSLLTRPQSISCSLRYCAWTCRRCPFLDIDNCEQVKRNASLGSDV